jgi:hypothetical protein
MGGPGVESLAPGGVPQPPAPQPLTPSGRETLAPIHARVFSCALSTSPPQILASGCGRCRAAGGVARRDGASLSDAAGAH